MSSMSTPFSERQLGDLRALVTLCKNTPLFLHHPKLGFFADFMRSMGAKIPPPDFEYIPAEPTEDTYAPHEEDKITSSDGDEDSDSDVELDMEGVIQSVAPDEFQDMGDESKEPTEEERDASDEKRSAAMKAFSEQKFDEAIKLYTEAIQLNPQSALMFSKRGQVYLKLNKLLSCIKDCTRALELNCDSAAAYKFRGRAYRLLGKFEEASQDLCESLKIDYDDQTNEWLNEVKPNAEKLRQHKLSAQRNKDEKEHSEKLRRALKAQEARIRAARAQAEAAAEAAAAGMGGYPGGFPGGMPGGFPGGMPGGFPGGMPGGMPGGKPGGMPADGPEAQAGAGGGQDFDSSAFASILMDPEIMAAIQDPEVAVAFRDVTVNPANFVKYQDNPKVAAVIQKLQNKLGKGAPGAFPGFGGFGGGPNAGSKPSDDDVGLD